MSNPMLTEDDLNHKPNYFVFWRDQYLTFFTNRERAQEYVTFAAIAQQHPEDEYTIQER